MQLQDILRAKGLGVHTICPDKTLDDVARALVELNCGSLLVVHPTDDGADPAIVGIITERDILRALAAHRTPLANVLVRTAMSVNLVTATPQDRIEVAMHLMTQHRVRHLPVVDGPHLCGLVSIGDLAKAHLDESEQNNYYMRSYIQGVGDEVVMP